MELAQIALEYSCTRRVEFYRAQGFYRVSKFQLAADLICSSWSWRGGWRREFENYCVRLRVAIRIKCIKLKVTVLMGELLSL